VSAAVRRRVLRGVGANVYGQVAIVVSQLVGVPILLNAWGDRIYGDWLILFAVPAYLAMTDLGFSISAANDMTARTAAGERDAALTVFQSVFALLLCLSGILLVTAIAAIYSLPGAVLTALVDLPAARTRLVLSLLCASVLIKLFDGLNQAGFRANGEYFVHACIFATIGLAQQVSVWVAALCGAGIPGAAMVYLAVTAIGVPATSAALMRRHRWVRFGVRHARLAEVQRLGLPAAGNLAIPMSQMLANQGMVIVVGSVLGPVCVVLFSTLKTLTRLSYQVLIAISNAAEPEFAALSSAVDRRRLTALFVQVMRASLWTCLPVVAALAFVGGGILTMWTHGRVLMDDGLFAWLLATMVSQTFWNGALSMLRAANRHVAVAGVQLASALLGVGFAYLLLRATHVLSFAGLASFVADLVLMQYAVRKACAWVGISVPALARSLLDPRPLARLAMSEESSYFLKKSNQKTFGLLRYWPFDQHGLKDQKFFASFFQKRSACLTSSGEQRIAFLLTHPIQYYAPLFRYLTQNASFSVKIYYQSACSVAGYFDRNFGRHIAWDNDLLAGYESAFLPCVGARARLSYWRPWCFGLRRRLRRNGVRHIVIAGYNRPFHWAAIAVAWSIGVRVWIRDDSNLISKHRSFVKTFLKTLVFGGLARLGVGFLSVGQANRAYFLAHGVPATRIRMLHWAVDTQIFCSLAAAAPVAAMRENFGIAPGQFALLFVGKLIAQKGIDVLLTAFAQAHTAMADKPMLVIVGDGAARAAVTEVAAGCDDIKYLGFRNQSELPAVYAMCDALVLPSTNFESWGLVVNEAMSLGKPVIVSDRVGCGPDLVSPATGWVAKAGDARSLADCIVAAAGSAREPRYREACLARIEAYTYRANLAQINEMLAGTR
jgi:glycosyltransferase involved in cell wall biosynthesis/O-antigen/teichoic acid export membrane protein